jgi:hypothetical protein
MNRLSSSRRYAGAFVLCAAAALGQAPAASGAAKVEETRPVLEKWAEARRTISLEKRDWVAAKDVLTERIAVVEREIASLRAKIAEAEKSIAEADRAKAELAAKNDKLKEGAQHLAGRATALEAKTKSILSKVPPSLREKLKPISQRLPEKPEETKVSLGERFRNVAFLLTEFNKFQREIVAESEVRKLADGSSAEVVALYLGLGRAYYYNGSKEHGFKTGGIGRLTPQGWTWEAADALSADIARAAAMMKNETPAAFVRVPAKVE